MKKFISLVLSLIMMLCMSNIAVFADEIKFGDANDDGVLDMKDALLIKKKMARKITNQELNLKNADINGDKKVDILDVYLIMDHLYKEKLIRDSVTYEMDSMTDCMSLVGRAVASGTELLLSQTGSGFKFNAECAGEFIFYMNIDKPSYGGDYRGKLAIIADDDYDNITTIDVRSSALKYQVDMGLEYGEHTFTVLKASEWSKVPLYRMTAITIFGKKGSVPPAQKPLKFEFYGDSITSGYGNLASNDTQNGGDWNYQDGSQTYATFVSNMLNAEFAIASASGHGVLGNHAQLGVNTYKDYFDYSIVGKNPTNWSRADYNADLIIINFGANDNTRDKNNLDSAVFKAECSQIIENMHKDNPNAKILWVTGMNKIDNNAVIISCLQDIAQKYDYVNFYHSPNKQHGGDAHPNIADHKELANLLADYIKTTYPEFFKDK